MRNNIKQITFILFSIGIYLLAAIGCAEQPKELSVTASVPSTAADLVKKGEHLVTIMGCGDCHTPKIMTEKGPAPNPDFWLAGHPASITLPAVDKKQLQSWVLFNMTNTAVVGPWGVSYAANISSDETGIGNWSEEQFFVAMRQGKWKGLESSRPLLPPMPWPNYTTMTDEELRAVFVYLKSTKPVKNLVPAPIPPDRL